MNPQSPAGTGPTKRLRPRRPQPAATRAAHRRLDVALVVDVTGSMGDELDYLTVELDAIVLRGSKTLQDFLRGRLGTLQLLPELEEAL